MAKFAVNRGGRKTLRGTDLEKRQVVQPRFTKDEYEKLKQAAALDFLPLALRARRGRLKAATGEVG